MAILWCDHSLSPSLQIREQFAGAHLSPEEVALRVLKAGESEAVKKESGTVQPGVKGSGVESGSEAARLQVPCLVATKLSVNSQPTMYLR